MFAHFVTWHVLQPAAKQQPRLPASRHVHRVSWRNSKTPAPGSERWRQLGLTKRIPLNSNHSYFYAIILITEIAMTCGRLRSGKLTQLLKMAYWRLIYLHRMVISHSYVSLPEGRNLGDSQNILVPLSPRKPTYGLSTWSAWPAAVHCTWLTFGFLDFWEEEGVRLFNDSRLQMALYIIYT